MNGGASSSRWYKRQRMCGDEREGNPRARRQTLRRDDRTRLQGAGSDAARRSAVYAFFGRDRHEGDLAAVDAGGQDQVQERQLHRPQGARDRRGGARHGARRDRGRDRRTAAQPEAAVPQRLGEDAPGLEVRRMAVDPPFGLSEGFKGRRASMSPHFAEATTSESATARRFAAVPSFGSDWSEGDIPRASGACRSDENDPKRQSLE